MLVVHCSDTPDDQLIGAKENEMHLGFGWDGIGYHQVIRRDGTRCRPAGILAGRACEGGERPQPVRLPSDAMSSLKRR